MSKNKSDLAHASKESTNSLSREEEHELFKMLEETSDPQMKEFLLQKLLRHNEGICTQIAKEYGWEGSGTFADRVQDGKEGLLEAVKHFNHERGMRFITYAMWWIRREVRDGICSRSPLGGVRFPLKALWDRNRAIKSMEKLRREFGENPTFEEIAKDSGVGIQTVKSALAINNRVASLDEKVGRDKSGKDGYVKDTVEQDMFLTPLEIFERKELRANIRSIMATRLSPRERFVLASRFGFGDYDEKTLKEIGDFLGLSREMIRQIEEQAMEKVELGLHRAPKRKKEK